MLNREDSFKLIANFWSHYLGEPEGNRVPISSHDVAAMMALAKIARSGRFPAEESLDTKEPLSPTFHAHPIGPTMLPIPNLSIDVAKTPCTVAEYEYFCSLTSREMPKQPEPSSPNNPVTNVSWYDAQEYCKWLSATTEDVYRLPKEEEFETFCGDHKEATEQNAVYEREEICQVATKEVNEFGLYDVRGLVWEWQEEYENE